LENQWRLTEILHDGTRHDFDAIAPVLVTFPPGMLAYQACNAGSAFFDTRGIEAPNAYRLRHGAGTMRGCPEPDRTFLQALYDTNRYEIEGDRLILSGDNAQLTFVIDNEATKPPDWM
jgi:heat shock protein HslJ